MGLIGKCGIVKTISEADLTYCVQMAYEAYRRDFLIRASRRRKMIYHHILREPRYDTENGRKKPTIDLGINDCQQLFPDIRFVGVWDTVDAYGMPVDELKIAIDEWVWPMSFADRDPSDRLQTIRHALSLDDERPTFRPVLWNEVLEDRPYPGKEMARRVLSPQRIQQVWFAGAHANVGGGYPDDGLAFTALDWMMEEAASVRASLSTRRRARKSGHASIRRAKQYDSRAGIAGYYRYGPRKVAELCDDKTHGVQVPTVRVHAEAYDRIASWVRDYAPVSLGGPFSVGGVAACSGRRRGAGAGLGHRVVATARLFLDARPDRISWPVRSSVGMVQGRPHSRISPRRALRTVWSFAGGNAGADCERLDRNRLDLADRTHRAGARLGLVFGAVVCEISVERDCRAGAAGLGVLHLVESIAAADRGAGRMGLGAGERAAGDGASADGLATMQWRARCGRSQPGSTVWVWRGICVNLLGLAIGLATLIVLLPIMKLRDLRRRPWMA